MKKSLALFLLIVILGSAISFSTQLQAQAAPRSDIIYMNDNQQVITYTGDWYYSSNVPGNYQNDSHYSAVVGAYAEFTFTGVSIDMIGSKTPDAGIFDVYIDDVFQASVDQYAATTVRQQVLWSSGDLTKAQHTIKFEVTGNKNANSTYWYVYLDAFRYSDGAEPPPTPTPGVAPEIILKNASIAFQGTAIHLSGNSTFQCSIPVNSSAPTIICHASLIEYDPGSFGVGGGNWYLSIGAGTSSGTLLVYYEMVVEMGQGSASFYRITGEALPAATTGTKTINTGSTSFDAGISGNPPYAGDVTGSVTITLSLQPIQQTCASRFVNLTTAGPYIVDPTIEFPQGSGGSPADEQTYPTVVGAWYGIRIGGYA